MIFYFDRNLGITIPKALQSLDLPVEIHYHQEEFPQEQDKPDDEWLPMVGDRDWVVISQDYKYHLLPNELTALKQHNVGVFYLWGAEAKKWDIMRLFARAYDKIVATATVTPKPFVYWVRQDGRLKSQDLN